ncbi:hypothetical protein TNCV_946741 [Trichonephila clavipes]|nr:hypothetical protein TNCV_946741 [Trichonephila clavipes]
MYVETETACALEIFFNDHCSVSPQKWHLTVIQDYEVRSTALLHPTTCSSVHITDQPTPRSLLVASPQFGSPHLNLPNDVPSISYSAMETATLRLLATDFIILNFGQVMWTMYELWHPTFQTTTPSKREDFEHLYRVSSGAIGLKLVSAGYEFVTANTRLSWPSLGVLRQIWGGTEPNRYVTCMVLKTTANDRRTTSLLPR